MRNKNTKLKKVYIKSCEYYHFDNTIKFKGFDFDDILLNKKSYENILFNDVLYKILLGTKLLYIMFDKADGSFKDYDGAKFLVLFGLEIYMM